ncbi:uncharacterized protein LOC133539906 isoform X6 [Nerophis ophidion]|uniref:uncharacterized protein LOC133539906 isoform X6 n=1 Tax=Nerophis ophidion TaxID=159077 RepID=UPI002AE042DB|nr:uncharacterized protein LOC133539906 isoform X6 [Nerophis ophidion]
MCERKIAEYEGELCPKKEKNGVDAVFKKHQVVEHGTAPMLQVKKPSVQPCTTDVQQPPHIKEDHLLPPFLKDADAEPSHIKEEEEEVWITQEEECLLGQEEADLTKFPLTVVSVKTEDKSPESSPLHHSPIF